MSNERMAAVCISIIETALSKCTLRKLSMPIGADKKIYKQIILDIEIIENLFTTLTETQMFPQLQI